MDCVELVSAPCRPAPVFRGPPSWSPCWACSHGTSAPRTPSSPSWASPATHNTLVTNTRTQNVGTDLHNILGQSVDPGAEPPGHGDAVLGVGDLVLVLLGGQHEVVVDGAGLDGVYQVDEGEAGGDGLVLEPGDRGSLPGLPQLVVGPL